MTDQKKLLLGPDGADKIALIGSAPSSVNLGPYRDPSWAIWCCSPGVYGMAPRKDVFFELHRWEPQEPGFPTDPHAKPWFSPEYVRFLEEFPGPVFMSHAVPTVKNCVLFPYQRMLDRYGPYHFTSSLAWMLAYAIEQRPKAIGIWGVDMAAGEEYAYQRPGCQHFLGLAKSLGIEIVVPIESDLLQPTTMYGIAEMHPRYAKFLARKKELEDRLRGHDATAQHHQQQALFVRGALDDLKHIMDHWALDLVPAIEYAVSHSKDLVGIQDPLIAMKSGGWPDNAEPNHTEVMLQPMAPPPLTPDEYIGRRGNGVDHESRPVETVV